MLFDVILTCWRAAAGLEDYLADLVAEEARASRALIQSLMDEDEERSLARFQEFPSKVQEATVAGLLLMALQFEGDAQVAGWAVSQAGRFSTVMSGGAAGLLEAHAMFLTGWALQLDGSRSRSETILAECEGGYQAAGADPVFAGLAAYARGGLALRADDLHGERVGQLGALELFDRARSLAEVSASHPLFRSIDERATYVLAQREWMDEVLQSPTPDLSLDWHSERVDHLLLELLVARTQRRASWDEGIEEAYAAARLADACAARLGEEPRELRQLTGWILKRRSGDAEWLLQQQLEQTPDDLELRTMLARVLLDDARYEEALPLLQDLVTASPDDARVRMMAGTALMETGQLYHAYDQFAQMVRLDPEDGFSQAMVKRLRPAVCFAMVEGELRVHPDANLLTEGEVRAGMFAAMLANDRDQLEARLEALAASDPDLVGDVVNILVTQRVISLQEDDPARAHLKVAEDHFARGEWTEAETAYLAAIAENPNLADAYMGLGDVHYRAGRYFLARAHFEESVAIEPTPMPLRFLGDTLRHMGKLREAADCYRQALELWPEYTGAREALRDLEAQLLEAGVVAPPAGLAAGEEAQAGGPQEQALGEYAEKIVARGPLDVEELERNIGREIPALGMALQEAGLERRMEVMRARAGRGDFERAIFALIALIFAYSERTGRQQEADELVRLRHQLALELPSDWDPAQGLGLSPARLRADTRVELAELWARRGEPGRALEYCRRAEQDFAEDQMLRKRLSLSPQSEFDRRFVRGDPRVGLYRLLSRIHAQLGDEAAAKKANEQAVELERQSPTTGTEISMCLTHGEAAFSIAEPDAGFRFLWHGLDLALEDKQRNLSSYHIALICQALGQGYHSLGLDRMARNYLERALELNRAAGHRGRLRMTHESLEELYLKRPDLGDPEPHRSELEALSEE